MHLTKALEIFEQLPEHLVNKKIKFELLKELAKCGDQQGSPKTEAYYLAALEISPKPIDSISIIKDMALYNARSGKF